MDIASARDSSTFLAMRFSFGISGGAACDVALRTAGVACGVAGLRRAAWTSTADGALRLGAALSLRSDLRRHLRPARARPSWHSAVPRDECDRRWRPPTP